MSRRPLALLAFITLAALACLSAPGAARPAAATRYIVELAEPPAGAGLASEAQADALGAALAAVAAPAPAYVYRHALSGFAADLTPAQAAALAAQPGVTRVEPDWEATVAAGPAAAPVATADLRPALFFARLGGVPAAPRAAGRAVAHYDGAAGVLSLQVFYGGVNGAPPAARPPPPPGGGAL